MDIYRSTMLVFIIHLTGCKLLIANYPGCVTAMTGGNYGGSNLSPFHIACANGSLELVEYLYNLHPDDDYEYDDDGNFMDEFDLPESLQCGYYALHFAASSHHDERKEVIRFVLEKDGQAASRVGKWGRLPLHEACSSNLNIGVIKAIFEAYPKAIHAEDMFGRLPIHFVMGCHEYRKHRFEGRSPPVHSSKRQTALVIEYLVKQLPYSLKAKDPEGRVCAHFACGSSLALRKTKAIEDKCPESFKVFIATVMGSLSMLLAQKGRRLMLLVVWC